MVCLIAASLGSDLPPRPIVHYRQHGRNTVGAKKFSGKTARLARVTQLEQMIASTIVQDLALHERLVQLHQRVPATLPGSCRRRQGGKEASYARRRGIAKQGRLRNMLFYCFTRAGYLKYLAI